MLVSKRASFDAAHYLPNYVGKCKNMHGHHWVVEVAVEGELDSETGMVCDFSDLSWLLGEIVLCLDHNLLNEVVENPTAENIAQYFISRYKEFDFELTRKVRLAWVKVWESEDSCVEVRC